MLYPLTACLLVAFFIFLVCILLPGANSSSKEPNALNKPFGAVCVSPRCIKDAVYLNSLLSWDHVNPCRDFYAFVCRQWTGSYTASEPGYFVSSDDNYVAYLEGRLHELLQNAPQGTNDSAVQSASKLYRKCVDDKSIENYKWDPLLELMSQAFLDGFPFTPPIRHSLDVWKTAARLLRMTGTSTLFSVEVSSHPSDPNRDVVFMGPPRLVMTFDDADINSISRLYTEAAFAAVRALKKEYVPPVFIAKIAEFASELEKLVGSAPSSNAPKWIKVHDLLMISVLEVFNGSTIVDFDNESHAMVSPTITKVVELAKNTDLHTVMNYFGVRLMIEVSPFIPDSGLTDFYGAFIYGRRRAGVPRWQLCVRAVEKATFPITYAAILADLNAHITASRLTTMANTVFWEFRRSIESSPHFTPESKLAIRSVLAATSIRALGPEWVKDKASMDAYVQKLARINSAGNALDTYVRFYEHAFQTSLRLRPRQRWSRSAFSPNCWYEPNPDTIYVPILAFNISDTLGGGNEELQLSRLAPRLYRCAFAFLLSKKELRMPGKVPSWFTGETERTLRSLEACIDRGQEPRDAGFRRTREVLAVNFAFDLFMKAVRGLRDPFSLQLAGNRTLNDKQLFFLSLVLQACEQSGEYENRASTTGHDWNMALSNTKYFGDAYACQPGSPMNTKEKCVLT
ncbi:endothelin-converting enzyme 1-like [Haemaphysalis longicornis]